MFRQRKLNLVYISILVLVLFISIFLFFFNQCDMIVYEPKITPEAWCDEQPCIQINLFSIKFILVQPSSTFFVYLLGCISVSIGFYLLTLFKKNKVIMWWGIALILWGLGALFAGTSYQAFSYEIKCAGRAFCIWTSWWEIIYLILSVGSVNAMMLSQSSLSDNVKTQKALRDYALVSFLIYIVLIVTGSLVPFQFLISFELLVVFLVPCILIFLIFNYTRWKRSNQAIDRHLLYVWIFLIIVMVAYFLYLILSVTEILWNQGIWFSENDILHIGLISWMIFIGINLKRFGLNQSNQATSESKL